MKLRFYLRGLGIGMAVTAVILHFAVAVNSHAMSDDEIRARARQLGMTEEGVMLAENTEAASGNQTTQEVIVGDTPEESTVPATTVPETSSGESTSGEAEVEMPGVGAPDESEDPGNTTQEPDGQGEDTPDTAQQQTPEQDPQPVQQQPTEPEEPEQPEPAQQQPQPQPGDDSPHGLNAGTITVTVVRGDTSYSVAKRMAEAGIVPSAAEFDEFLCKNGYDRTLCVGVHEIPSGASYDEMGRILTGK